MRQRRVIITEEKKGSIVQFANQVSNSSQPVFMHSFSVFPVGDNDDKDQSSYLSNLIDIRSMVQVASKLTPDELTSFCEKYSNFNYCFHNSEEFWRLLYLKNIGPILPKERKIRDYYLEMMRIYHEMNDKKDYKNGLFQMAKYGAILLVKYFAEQGGKDLTRNIYDEAMLNYAACTMEEITNHKEIIDLMISLGAKYAYSVITVAAKAGNYEIIEFMLTKEVHSIYLTILFALTGKGRNRRKTIDVVFPKYSEHITDEDFTHLVKMAIDSDYLEIIELFLSERGNWSYVLHMAAYKNKINVVKMAIEHELNDPKYCGNALVCADNCDMVRLILTLGDDQISSGYYWAVRNAITGQHLAILKLLFPRAEKKLSRNDFIKLMIDATEYGLNEFIRPFLESKVIRLTHDEYGMAILAASRKKRDDVVIFIQSYRK